MSELNDWFLSLPESRQAVLRDDKWFLAEAAFAAGKAARAQPAQAGQALTDEEIDREWQFGHDEEGNPPNEDDFARAIEQAVLAKRVPMTEIEKKAAKWDAINAVWLNKETKLEDLVSAILRQRIEEAERHHGIVGERGDAT